MHYAWAAPPGASWRRFCFMLAHEVGSQQGYVRTRAMHKQMFTHSRNGLQDKHAVAQWALRSYYAICLVLLRLYGSSYRNDPDGGMEPVDSWGWKLYLQLFFRLAKACQQSGHQVAWSWVSPPLSPSLLPLSLSSPFPPRPFPPRPLGGWGFGSVMGQHSMGQWR